MATACVLEFSTKIITRCKIDRQMMDGWMDIGR